MKTSRLRRILEKTLYKHLKKEGRPILRAAVATVRQQIRKYPGQPSPKLGPPARRTGKYAKLIKIKTKFKRVKTKEGYVFHKSGIKRLGGLSIVTYLKIQQSPIEKILGTRHAKYGRYRPLKWPPIDQTLIARRALAKGLPEVKKAVLNDITEAVNWPSKPIPIKLTTG